jgi:hypothetical protein
MDGGANYPLPPQTLTNGFQRRAFGGVQGQRPWPYFFRPNGQSTTPPANSAHHTITG